MSGTLSKIVIFAVGVAIGSVTTWKLLDAKYKKIAEDEIADMKQYYSNKADINDGADEADIHEYKNELEKNGYVDHYDYRAHVESKKEVEKMGRPYVITPDEFGEIDEYEKVSLKYYSDGCLTDDQDDIIEDVDEVIGYESLNHFGEFEEDSVFVRNDALKTDYEILLDPRDYYEIVNGSPRNVED